MSPLNYYRDTVGPLGRTVTDVALVFQAMVGADPLDPLTDLLALNNVTIPANYTQFLTPNALKVHTHSLTRHDRHPVQQVGFRV